KIPVDEWLSKPGLPASAPVPAADVFAGIDRDIAAWVSGGNIQTGAWVTQEWLHFLRGLPEKLDATQMSRLDSQFHFTASHNDEILQQWLLMSVRNHYQPAA